MSMSTRGIPVKLICDSNDPRGRSRTHQSFAKDADINNIMGKYQRTGILVDPSIPRTRFPQFGDFSDVIGYSEVVERIQKAQTSFDLLPSDIREKFDYSVQKAIDFISDPVNYDESVKLGLLPANVGASVKTPALTSANDALKDASKT